MSREVELYQPVLRLDTNTELRPVTASGALGDLRPLWLISSRTNTSLFQCWSLQTEDKEQFYIKD